MRSQIFTSRNAWNCLRSYGLAFINNIDLIADTYTNKLLQKKNKQNIKKALQKVQIKGIIYKDNLFLLRRTYGEEKNSSAYIK